MSVRRVSTFGASLTFVEPGLTFVEPDGTRFGRDLPSPGIGNICRGCGEEMPLQDEKVFVPGRGSFHVACEPA